MLCAADLNSRFAGKEHDWRKRRECNKAYAETFRRKLKDRQPHWQLRNLLLRMGQRSRIRNSFLSRAPATDETRAQATRKRKPIMNCLKKHLFASFLMIAALFFAASSRPALAQSVPPLGTSQTFAVLGASTVTNTGPTVVSGNVGVWSGTAITGFPPGLIQNGAQFTGPGLGPAKTARDDAILAYNNLVGQACGTNLTGNILGQTPGFLSLSPGVYCFNTSAQLNNTLVLLDGGNPNAIFIFKIGTTLTTGTSARVLMSSGGRGPNVYWQIGSSATIGTSTIFRGNIIAFTDITMVSGATTTGRLHALSGVGGTIGVGGAVTLDSNLVDAVTGVGPTAANGNISGRITDSNGNPVEGAVIRLNGTQNRKTIADANGNYNFDNVETTGAYTVEPSRPNFTFSPSRRSFSQFGQHTESTFVATSTGDRLNPLDATEYFVRQQYLDFLGREPDESGFNFWVNNIESCGADANCSAVKRIDTSAAFFLSIEFQQTGYLVERTYRAAYGEMPNAPVPIKLGEFKPDTQEIGNGVIVNQTGWQATLETNKQAFMTEFVQRARFTSVYPTTLSPIEFVDRMFMNAGVTPSDSDRMAAVNEFGGAPTVGDATARGRALRDVAENSTLQQQEFDQAFVLMEYFGYLRRDANSGSDTDFSGYNFWLTKLDSFNGNYANAEMVKAFLVAGEYRGRFPK
jgi:hypothetical protein